MLDWVRRGIGTTQGNRMKKKGEGESGGKRNWEG